MPSDPRRWNDRDRMDAEQVRLRDRRYFADEEPEPRTWGTPPEHTHPVDGYCDHHECKGWRQAD